MSHPLIADIDQFAEIWLVDFEFHQPEGEPPHPICMVAREWRTGRTFRLWQDDLRLRGEAPFPVNQHGLVVAYYLSAELGCFLTLNWPVPMRLLDLYAEFRCFTSGLTTPCGSSLLGALAYFGLDAIGAAEKSSLRELAIRGGPYTFAERVALLDYCESDVLGLDRLLPVMLPHIDLPRALLRGRYMAAAARIERLGVPIDVLGLTKLRTYWKRVKSRLISEIDADYGVFVPAHRRPIDPNTPLGAAILSTADEYGMDPHDLSAALEEIHREELAARKGLMKALAAARKATGLSRLRISRWERFGGRDGCGRDYSSYPGLDVKARELAAEYPILGLGPGYNGESPYDDIDYAGRLWELLRDAPPATKRKNDPEMLRRAAEFVCEAVATFDMIDGLGTQPMVFSAARFAEWLARSGIPWPRLDSGALALDRDTFREMARAHPKVATLRELRDTLSELQMETLAVGSDGRNRCLLSAFASKTGRNQPSNARFIFGPSVWLRGLIRPDPGCALAYVDWEQQEFGIAAALSGDKAMQAAYLSGDPYLAFAKRAHAVPANATKQTYGPIREQFKACVLAVQYGMGERSLAQRIGQPEAYARELLRLHRQTFPRFWRWSQSAVDHAMLHGYLYTVFGWRVHVGQEANPRSLANFPMQANGAEMLRVACCLATERGIHVCAPVHDALLVEGPSDEIKSIVAATQDAMREASETALGGFALRTDAKVVGYPERFMDPRGERMWNVVWRLIDELGLADDECGFEPVEKPGCSAQHPLLRPRNVTCCSVQHPSS